MIDTLIFWMSAVAGVTFLVICVGENRKSGFRRNRSEISLVEEGLRWIEEVEGRFLDDPQEQLNLAKPVPLKTTEEAVASTQLMNLGLALGEGKSPSPVPAEDPSLEINPEAESQSVPKGNAAPS